MYLINTKSQQLEKFSGDKIPPYAILSHCWGNDWDEASFKDITTSSWQTKAGSIKIICAISTTNTGHLSYLWVDTCCIDKSSSAEESEAINSMYQWYSRAPVCYAYLEDVQFPADKWTPAEYKFPNARWFTRGWTLQELLAPSRVKFFDFQWTYIGSKQKLSGWIARITGIPERVLISPREIPLQIVAKRMSWASKRHTKRLEDTAYCLLGIFGINIPLLYGEGERAFRRLQVELIKEIDDETIFAWYSHARVFGVFARSPADFIYSSEYVPIQDTRRVDSSPYTMTNRGLHIQLPIIEDLQQTWAILNCHDGLNFETRMGIHLLNSPNPSVFKRSWRGMKLFYPEEIATAEL
jgi:hypothetical protein